MDKKFLDKDGLTRLWTKVKEKTEEAQLSPLYVNEERVLETTTSLPSYRGSIWLDNVATSPNAGRLYSSSNSICKYAQIGALGLKAGDRLLIRVKHTYNTTKYGFYVEFFSKSVTDPETGTTTIQDLEIGDIPIQYTSFSYQGELKDMGEVIVPEGATHLLLSHYRRSIAMYMEARLVIKAEEPIDRSTINDLLANWETRYSVSSKRHVRGDNGGQSSVYGTEGVYYMINTYIDVRYVERLCFRLEAANPGYSGQGGMALLAAYDANKTYLPNDSIVTTAACTRQGEWVRPHAACYIRFTICTTRNPLYLFDPDRIGTLERKLAAELGDSTANGDWKEGILPHGASITFPSNCYGSVKIISSTDGNGHGAVTREILVDMPNSTTVVASKYPANSDDDSITVQTGEIIIEDGTAQYVCKLNVKPTFEGDVIFTGNSPEANMEGVVFASDGAAMSAGDVNILTSTNVLTIVKLTQAAYDALEEKDEQTLYLIIE